MPYTLQKVLYMISQIIFLDSEIDHVYINSKLLSLS